MANQGDRWKMKECTVFNRKITQQGRYSEVLHCKSENTLYIVQVQVTIQFFTRNDGNEMKLLIDYQEKEYKLIDGEKAYSPLQTKHSIYMNI